MWKLKRPKDNGGDSGENSGFEKSAVRGERRRRNMTQEQFQRIINSPGVWISCIIMVSIIVAQSVVFLRGAVAEAKKLGISPSRQHSAMRAACVSAVGPSLSPVIIALSMMTIVGAPNAWLNLNNIGAARTELANVAIGASFAGVHELSGSIGLEAWGCALWACALNGAGWMIVVFFLNHRMEHISQALCRRYDKALVTVLMGAAVTSLFCYLLGQQLVNKGWEHYLAAVISGCCMWLLIRFCKKNSVLQEISLGVSMLTGMLLTQLLT